MTAKEVRETAAAWMEAMAADDSHGYDQGSRWGPDYDCSSLVISAYKRAGVPLTCTYTGNMKADMLSHGFKDVTASITLKTGKGLKRGDVLLHEVQHTAMVVGDGKIVHAAGNEYGRATGGKTGDQTGREICKTAYYNMPWQVVLRYEGKDAIPPSDSGNYRLYTVQPGDSFWKIADEQMGDGSRYAELASFNGMTPSSVIHPGQQLKILVSESDHDPAPAPDPVPDLEKQTVSVELPVLRKGDAGGAVMSLQALLLANGIDVGPTGMDGYFGEATWVAVCDLQRERGTAVTGEIGSAEWKALIG